MCVKVVFDERQTHFAGGAYRLFDLLDFFVPFRAAVEAVRKACDHQVAEIEPSLLQLVNKGAKFVFSPWNRRSTSENPIDSNLLDAPNGSIIERLHLNRSGDLRSTWGFTWHPGSISRSC
jgi:hypothetical protein